MTTGRHETTDPEKAADAEGTKATKRQPHPDQAELDKRDKAKEADRKAAAEAGAPSIQIGGGPDSEVG